MNIEALEFHPAANAFPMMDAKRFEELKADIERQGQIEPITTCDGMVLDGRNRYKALTGLGIPPKIRSFDGDPWAYVWSSNGARRDLAELQRAIIKEKCDRESCAWNEKKKQITEDANRKRSEAMQGLPYAPKGEDRKEKVAGTKEPQLSPKQSEDRHPTRAAKAKAANVSPSTQAKAEWIINNRRDLADQVASGEISGADAFREMKREQVIANLESVEAREQKIISGTYDVIVIDPPWQMVKIERKPHETHDAHHQP